MVAASPETPTGILRGLGAATHRVDIRLTALQDTLRRLIAGATISFDRVKVGTVSSTLYSVERNGVTFTLISGKPDFVFLLSLHGVGSWQIRISRTSPPFTKIEERLFGRLPKTLLKAFSANDDHRRDAPSQLGALLALDHLLVAQVLRRDVVGGYWTHLVIMQALIDLTFARYEGNKATSGVVYSLAGNVLRAVVENRLHVRRFLRASLLRSTVLL